MGCVVLRVVRRDGMRRSELVCVILWWLMWLMGICWRIGWCRVVRCVEPL